MKALRWTQRFKKDYKRLPEPIRRAFVKQVGLLLENPDHPSLDLKKMRDPRDIWRCKITAGYRMTFQIEDDAYVLRRVGPHDIEREP
jgi:mRNA-degrading endonuclease RelE of RelBE toxin-antitoxin system